MKLVTEHGDQQRYSKRKANYFLCLGFAYLSIFTVLLIMLLFSYMTTKTD